MGLSRIGHPTFLSRPSQTHRVGPPALRDHLHRLGGLGHDFFLGLAKPRQRPHPLRHSLLLHLFVATRQLLEHRGHGTHMLALGHLAAHLLVQYGDAAAGVFVHHPAQQRGKHDAGQTQKRQARCVHFDYIPRVIAQLRGRGQQLVDWDKQVVLTRDGDVLGHDAERGLKLGAIVNGQETLMVGRPRLHRLNTPTERR